MTPQRRGIIASTTQGFLTILAVYFVSNPRLIPPRFCRPADRQALRSVERASCGNIDVAADI